MAKTDRKTLQKVLNGARVAITLVLVAALMAQAGIFNGTCAKKAYAEMASSHSIAKNVGTIAQFDNGAYVHDFKEGVLGVNGEVAFCMDPNTPFKPGTVSSADLLSIVSQAQLTNIALRALFTREIYQDNYLSDNARIILAQTLVWEVLSPSQKFVVRGIEDGGTFPEVTAAVREDVCAKARAFADANVSRYESYGTLWVNGSSQPVATFGCRLAVGTVDLLKQSSNPSASDRNCSYALEGAVYGIYADATCNNLAARLTTDANGYAKSAEISAGSYYVREMTAPRGYEIDGTVYPVTVTAGQTARVGGSQVADMPLTRQDLAMLSKHDSEIGWHPNLGEALGAATVAGAQYIVEHYGGSFANATEATASGTPLAAWTFSTDEDGRIDLSKPEDYLVSGTLYRNAEGNIVFPLGTYVMREASPSPGYLLSSEEFVVTVEQDGDHAAMTGDSRDEGNGAIVAAAEQVKRGNIALTKVRESDMTRLAGIPFTLTSETTGESHVVVTDENGRMDTSSEWNPHTEKTNANDAALDEEGNVDESKLDASAGVWFGLSPSGEPTQADDLLGALPYDTYTLAELPCSANAGLVLVRMEGISAKRDGVTLDLGTIDDKDSSSPSIDTVAYDAADQDKLVSAEETARVRDEVAMRNLVEGRTYALYGAVIAKESGLPALASPRAEDSLSEEGSEDGAMPGQEEIQGFWNGLVELLGAKAIPSIDGFAYEMGFGSTADKEAISQYLAENEDISSRMMIASQEFTADAPNMVTTLDYEMDVSAMEGDYVIYDLLVADDGTMAIHADTANEQESFAVEQPTQDTPGKGYFKTGSILDGLEGSTGASGMVAAGTAIGAGLFLGRRRLGSWCRG